jgi:3-oxoacyl-[acyl-carrier-protein] synthase-1
MRRVVVTGLGIVSSIGNDAAEVEASLRDTRSGITFSQDFADHGFRSQVWGLPTLDPAPLVDRRAMRFLHRGGAWNHVAMLQAIADGGLEETKYPTSAPASSWGQAVRPLVRSSRPMTPH